MEINLTMKKRIFLCFIFTICSSFSKAQGLINVDFRQDPSGKFNIFCNNDAWCNYIVVVSFPQFVNVEASHLLPYRGTVKHGYNKLFDLRTINATVPAGFNIQYLAVKGCEKVIVDSTFSYLMPIAPGNKTEILSISNLSQQMGATDVEFWYCLGFKMDDGDTIFASRRGVVNIIHESENLESEGYLYAKDDNFIEIFHDDCTFGVYKILSKSLVKAGQYVEAGDPIAIAGGKNYDSGYHVEFYVYHNVQKEIPLKDKREQSYENGITAVPLVFYSEENKEGRLEDGETYTSDHPVSIITKEMTKKQKSKWLSKHGIALTD